MDSPTISSQHDMQKSMTEEKNNLHIAQYSFLVALTGSIILLLSAIGLRLATTELSSTVLAILALVGGILLASGLSVYVGFVAMQSMRKTPSEEKH